MKVFLDDIQQGSSDWLELRKTKITATDAAIIMGVNPWKTSYKLWRQKMDLDEPDEETEKMRKGSLLEPQAREWLEATHNITCEPKVVINDFMMASLDGMTKDGQLIVEIKCGDKAFSQAHKGEIPDYYIYQIQHQLACCNLDNALYVAFNGKEGIVLHVKRNQSIINEMIEKERKFFECLITFTPPAMTNKDYRVISNFEWERLSNEYKSVQAGLKEYERKEKELKEKMIVLCEEQSSMGNGIKVSKIPRKGAIDYSLIPELEGINLEKYRKKTIEYWKVTVDL